MISKGSINSNIPKDIKVPRNVYMISYNTMVNSSNGL